MITTTRPQNLEDIIPLQKTLHKCIDDLAKPLYNKLPHLLLREILAAWFTEGGGSYYFLLRKNAYVTNISFGELIALIKVHTHRRTQPETTTYLHFQTSKRFKENFKLLWESLGKDMDRQHIKNKVALILGSYPQLFSKTILVDPFFGSAVVHLPHPLKLDLLLICREAGYIHSCGKAIYVRKVVKSERNQLVDNVEAYIQQRERTHPGQTTFFSTYSHEQFTQDRHNKPDSRHGLHDVTIDLAKFHLDNTPLFDVLSDLKTRLKARIHIPPGIEGYNKERADFKHCQTANRDVTLWLLKDKSLPEDGGKFLYPGKDQYFVCYAQQYANRNPFISFKERKPAWIAPTTLPHTLATAMLNLARPYLPRHMPRHKHHQALTEPKQEVICILDPFSGTGTTFLETLKLGCTCTLLLPTRIR